MEQSKEDQPAEQGSQPGDEEWDEQHASVALPQAKAKAKQKQRRQPSHRAVGENLLLDAFVLVAPFPSTKGVAFVLLETTKKHGTTWCINGEHVRISQMMKERLLMNP